MPVAPRIGSTLLLLTVVAAWCDSSGAADRFVASLADGRKVSTPRLNTWPVPGAPLRWGDEDLLAQGNPARLVRDRAAGVQLRPPFLLLANGDVLTGSPTELDSGLGREQEAPRVKVQLEGMLPVTGTSVTVRTDRITRIVGSADAPASEPPPGTVQLADGRRLVARSIKWRDYGLAMLTEEGIVEANYAEIVDAVFPGVDRTAAVLDDNLWAGGTSAGTLARFQLAGGAIVTTSRISREQERSRRRGRIGVEVAIYYYVQPAWAEQPLALPENEISWCGLRPADQAPLSLLPVEVAATRRLIGSGPVWRRNAGADGGLATCGDAESDLAIGTHAHSELAIDLPAGTRTLQTLVGLDRTVAPGGCVRCQIVAGKPGGRVLWDSGILLGDGGPQATGPIDVAGLDRIVLVTHMAHDERPPGADPLDIRDQVLWLSPLVRIDFDPAQRLPAVLAGLAPWELSGGGLKEAQITGEWNPRLQTWDHVLALPKGASLQFTRRLHVSASGDVVELRTACPDELEEHEFTLRVDGREVGWCTNAARSELRKWLHSYGRQRLRDEDDAAAMSDRLAYWWDLRPWRGRDVTVELSLGGSRERNEIAWRGFAVRSAVVNLPDDGRPLPCDVTLTSLTPSEVVAPSKRSQPTKDHLPGKTFDDPAIRFLGQSFTGGYAMTRDSSVSFALAPDCRRFVAIAGCASHAAGPMRVLIDGQVAWERALMLGLAPAEQIDIPIPVGAKTLTLQTGKEGAAYGCAAWVEAGFTK